MNRLLLLSILLCCALGCGPSSAKVASGSTAPADPSASAEASPSASPTASPPLPETPTALQNDAYRYYGLSNTKPVDLEMNRTGQATPKQGALESKIEAVKGDSATYTVSYTGALADDMGTSEVKLDKDGIHVLSTSKGEVVGDNIELPSKLPVGATWHTKSTVKLSGGESVSENLVYKVVGIQKVDTKATTYENALLVVGTGTMTLSTGPYEVTAKAWYVKDKGTVRSEMVFHGKNGVTNSVTMQERKGS